MDDLASCTSNQLLTELGVTNLRQVRSNIERIIASYRHISDYYSELIQNSVDAVIDEFGINNIANGQIMLDIATEQRKIVITDNGIGIN